MSDQSGNNHSWYEYEQGRSLGKYGSEKGIIIRDEAYGGVRITLERLSPTANLAITCGISDWLVHTRYFGKEVEAQQAFEEMKTELARIYDFIPNEDDPNADAQVPDIVRALKDFITRFP